MAGVNYGSPPLFGKDQDLFQTLAPQVILIHHRQVLGETQLIIRFANSYGVALLPVAAAGNEQVLAMLVLKFHGPKINDYNFGQYAPLPEFNRGSFPEILDLCRQVSLLPQSRALTLCSSQSATRKNKGEEERRCSNFS